jgi:hypothetical protein
MTPDGLAVERRGDGRVEAVADADGGPGVTAAVCFTVAAALDADPLALPPLADAVAPDGLASLVDARGADAGAAVRFRYADCAVSVRRADGAVTVTVDRSPAASRGAGGEA